MHRHWIAPLFVGLFVAACSTSPSRVEPGSAAPTSTAPTSTAPHAATWDVQPLQWRSPADAMIQNGITLLDVAGAQLALGVDEAYEHQRLLVWHTDDGITWNWAEAPTADGTVLVQPRMVLATAVDGPFIAAVGSANRLIDPHLPDGSGVHADPGDVVGGVWWSTDGGATWQRTSTTEAAQFQSVSIIDGDIWAGGSVGSNSALRAAVWRLHEGTLSQEGVFGTPSYFGMVSKISKEDGTIVVDVMAQDYSATRQQWVGGKWSPTGEKVPAVDYFQRIELEPAVVFSGRGVSLRDGELEVLQGSYLQRADLAFCFVDATTCKTEATGFVVRRGDGPWQLLDSPDLGYSWAAPAPQIRDHHLVVYSAAQGGVPTSRATLDLSGSLVTIPADPVAPALPAPVFDGTLVVDQPEALEIGVGCGAEQLTINGALMGPVSLTDGGMPASVPIRRHGFGTDGPTFAVYGLLVLRSDGTVEFTNAAGERLTTYVPTTPPEFMCG